MSENFPPLPDTELLRAFAAVAKERNMRKAAQSLHISQPPLSRKIQRLERRLGLALFKRRTDGMELTKDGQQVLAIILPFLDQAARVEEKLALMAEAGQPDRALGLTTAFEQSVLRPYMEIWRREFGREVDIARKESPRLARDVAQGKLAGAFVALPLATAGLSVIALDYCEKLLAAMPASWPEAERENLSLAQLNGKPMFWFQRKRNPAWFDHMLAVFHVERFSPAFIEEPAEHDVLLARIAFGEGWALLPESFAVLPRQKVKFKRLCSEMELSMKLGFICRQDHPLATNFRSFYVGKTATAIF